MTDYPTLDRAVGADADRKREIYKHRRAEKARLQDQNPGKTVVRNDDGGYGVIGV